MNLLTSTRPLTTLVADHAPHLSWMDSYYAKVNKILTHYADKKVHTMLSMLTLLDVWDFSKGELHKNLLGFINSLPNDKAYKQQAKSRLKRIVKAILFGEDSGEMDGARRLPELDVPDFLLPLLPALPRVGSLARSAAAKSGIDASNAEKASRMALPLSEVGYATLTAMLKVVNDFAISDLESLFITHDSDVRKVICDLFPPNKWNSYVHCFRHVGRRIGFKKGRGPKRSLTIEEWPPALREQWQVLVSRAPDGLELHPDLLEKAARWNIEVKSLKKNTMTLYERGIGIALVHFNTHNLTNLDVRDLLKLEPIEVIEDGYASMRLHNPLVDVFREHQRNLVTDRKRRGYDSQMFSEFTAAIKCLAAYNGIFHLHEPFNSAYKINLDLKTRKRIKAEKKRLFDIKWIDSEIGRLYEDFLRITDNDTFKVNDEGSNKAAAAEAMRLCLFFVTLVMLRYMGYRQQCLRNCKVGENIIFASDGTIHLRWEKEQTKNSKVLIGHLDSRRHKEAHGLLIAVLKRYYRRVYPYIIDNSDGDLDGQFFVRCNRQGRFIRFPPDDVRSFCRSFKSWSLTFLHFGERLKGWRQGLHPHFFRGLAADWLYYELKVAPKNVAALVGDVVKTVERQYLDRDRAQDATPALDEASEAKRKQRQINGNGDSRKGRRQEEARDVELARKDYQITELLQQAKLIREQLEREQAFNAALQVEIAKSRR